MQASFFLFSREKVRCKSIHPGRTEIYPDHKIRIFFGHAHYRKGPLPINSGQSDAQMEGISGRTNLGNLNARQSTLG